MANMATEKPSAAGPGQTAEKVATAPPAKPQTFVLMAQEGHKAPREMGRYPTRQEAEAVGRHLVETKGCPVVQFEIVTA